MRAVILAGGKGRRLAPYTITFPKPMVPVGDMPILEIVIRQLKLAGFTHVTLAVGHLAELLMAYFQDGSRWGLRIDYSREEAPLGTTGPLLLIEDLPDDFLVMNGDVLTTLNYAELFRVHLRSKAALTVACHRCNTKVDLGVIEFDGRMQVTGYREKPTIPYDVSMGVYVFNRRALGGSAHAWTALVCRPHATAGRAARRAPPAGSGLRGLCTDRHSPCPPCPFGENGAPPAVSSLSVRALRLCHGSSVRGPRDNHLLRTTSATATASALPRSMSESR